MALVGTGWPRGDSKRSCAPQAVAGLGPRRPRCDSNRSCAPQAVAGLEPRRPRGDSDRGGVSMADARLAWLPATELAALIKRKKVSPVEVVDGVLDRIRTINPRLNAFVTLTEESARREAKVAERALMKRGARLGPLHGVPFSVKDLVITRGVRTTFGTPLYRDNVPTEDAPIVERMKAAGGIMLGKTNTPTFGWIGATHNLVFGVTRNPWNLERTPGGSSGGASAAAAAGLGPLHIGTDGGGSIRIPASCAGIFGHKPSYGRIPTHPASGAWSLSHIGPLTRTVADAALMMTVCAGPDERDQYSLPSAGEDYLKTLRGGVKGLRIAYTDDLGFVEAVDPEVRAACAKAARAFRELGSRVEEGKPGWPSPREAWGESFCGGVAPPRGDAGRLGAGGVPEGGAADRAADRRPPVRRPDRAAGFGGLRARAPVGPAASRAGVGPWSDFSSSCRRGGESCTSRCAWCSGRSAASK